MLHTGITILGKLPVKSSTVVALCLCLMSQAYAGDAGKNTPKRIVSTANYLTEIIVALDKQSELVGIDTTSISPAGMTRLPDIGYRRNLSLEGVLSLKPDYILLADDAGPPAVIKQLQTTGVAYQIIPSKPYEMTTLFTAIKAISQNLGVSEKGEELIQDLMQKKAVLAAANTENTQEKVKVMLMMDSGGTGSKTFAGRNTAADALLQFAGAENVFSKHFEGYKAVSEEAQLTQMAAVLLIGKVKNYGALTQKYQILEPSVETSKQALRPHCRIEIDMGYFLTFGINSVAAAADLQTAIKQCLQRVSPEAT